MTPNNPNNVDVNFENNFSFEFFNALNTELNIIVSCVNINIVDSTEKLE